MDYVAEYTKEIKANIAELESSKENWINISPRNKKLIEKDIKSFSSVLRHVENHTEEWRQHFLYYDKLKFLEEQTYDSLKEYAWKIPKETLVVWYKSYECIRITNGVNSTRMLNFLEVNGKIAEMEVNLLHLEFELFAKFIVLNDQELDEQTFHRNYDWFQSFSDALTSGDSKTKFVSWS